MVGAVAIAALAGCASPRRGSPDNEPTLATLADRKVTVAPDGGVQASPEQAIAAYRAFLAAAPNAIQRAEASRRLGDLEMAVTDDRSAQTGAAPDYRAAIARYTDYLRAYPKDPGNHRVLYQLARAQELSADAPSALSTLDRLVAEFPAAPTLDEVQFRRGELLFTARRHPDAERAFAAVLRAEPASQFRERALFMHGWSLFKQGRLDESLHSFFGVLEGKLAPDDAGTREALTRADRELLEDTFRVTSLALQNLQGAASIPAYVTTSRRQVFEPQVYSHLAELYLKQERIKDAADSLAAFARVRPLHAQAPVFLSHVIEIHEKNGFAALALQSKKDYVARYGLDSGFQSANPEVWQSAQPFVKTHLAELARHHHALAQKSRSGEDVDEAVRWYRAWLASFPNEPEAAQSRFLLAELLYENARYDDAATAYEQVAYDYPLHARSADAGYAVLLAQTKLEQAATDPAGLQRVGVARALRFADAFPVDPRTGPVLTHAAETLFALKDSKAAVDVAERVLALKPPAPDAQRRVAWTVVSHGAFERADFLLAEAGYRQVLALTPASDKARAEVDERLAASIYKQGEAARSGGQLRDAVAHFDRVSALGSATSVMAPAQYDAAATLIALKDWPGATRALQDFRQRFPGHALAAEIPAKLALAHLEQQQWGPAAAELERMAPALGDAAAARDAHWQVAELYAKAGQRSDAQRAFERYVASHPQPLAPAIDARQQLADFARQAGDRKTELSWLKAIQQADRSGADERSERTRTLAARATLQLSEPVFESYRQLRLVEPLQRSLKLKKARLEEALQACATLSEYGVTEAVTAAAFHSAALYQHFGQAMMQSERPRKLSRAALEQYNVMLEEQAFPFEEKAIELHEANARRAADGLYDDWVQRSFAALATLKPARYAKAERGAVTATLAELEQRGASDAAGWTALGVARRRQGQFKGARDAYDQALALNPMHADALLDQAILHDLYLGQRARALDLYQGYLALLPSGDATVSKWVADLKTRRDPPITVSRKEGRP